MADNTDRSNRGNNVSNNALTSVRDDSLSYTGLGTLFCKVTRYSYRYLHSDFREKFIVMVIKMTIVQISCMELMYIVQ